MALTNVFTKYIDLEATTQGFFDSSFGPTCTA